MIILYIRLYRWFEQEKRDFHNYAYTYGKRGDMGIDEEKNIQDNVKMDISIAADEKNIQPNMESSVLQAKNETDTDVEISASSSLKRSQAGMIQISFTDTCIHTNIYTHINDISKCILDTTDHWVRKMDVLNLFQKKPSSREDLGDVSQTTSSPLKKERRGIQISDEKERYCISSDISVDV